MRCTSLPVRVGWSAFAFLMFFASQEFAFAQNDLLVSSPFSNSIERFDGFTGEYLGSFVSPGSGGLIRPGDVAVGPDGNLYVSSSQSAQIMRYDGTDGSFIDVFASGTGLTTPNKVSFNGDYMYVGNFTGSGNGVVSRFDAMTGAFDSEFLNVDNVDGIAFRDDSIYVSNFFGGVERFDATTGAFQETFIAANEGGLRNPTALLFTPDDELLVSSYGTNSVKKYSQDGDFLEDAIIDLLDPEGLAYGLDGELYAGSYTNGVINRYDDESYAFLNEFANSGPVTNFFSFRGTAVPEPNSAAVLFGISTLAGCFHRRRVAKGLA